jgi:predicted ABC-type transport system involved in lysophospholipase L1 biosynthesis ATPase subunit
MSSAEYRPFAVPRHEAPDLRPPIVSAHDVFKDYRDGTHTITVLRGLNLDVAAGEAVAITGRSGSGKSTLLHLLGLLDRPTRGQIYFRGQEIGRLGEWKRNRLRARRLGFVFQAYHLVAELSAYQNVLLAARVAARWGWMGSAAAARRETRHLLRRVGLGRRMGHRPGKLSGGEKQRVAIARALMGEPEVLLADEPTGNLDASTARAIEDLLFELAEERRLAMVLVTHEPGLAARCSRVLALESGRLLPRADSAAGVEVRRVD